MSTRSDAPEKFEALYSTGSQHPHPGPRTEESVAAFERGPRDWISGFLLLGLLLGLIGSLLVAWQYHIDTDPRLIGLHFLCLNVGYVVASLVTPLLLRSFSIRSVALFGCVLSCGSLLALAFLAPPAPFWWRLSALAALGLSAGVVAASLLHVLSAYYTRSPARAINSTGTLFGCGCTLATTVVGTTYFAGSVPLEVGLLAIVPLIFIPLFLRSRFPASRLPFTIAPDEQRLRDSLRDLRSIAGVLFSLLLFFQFGNEWVIAGWLAIFLIHRLGANPVFAIFTLALHFISLTAARLVVRRLLAFVSHRRMLYWSLLISMGGYLLLSLTTSIVGACLASVVVGIGYAPIYPIVAETLDHRFSFHPGFYQGIFSVAITGAMSAPWLVGYVDHLLGTQYIMLLPALGSIAVLVLTLSIRFEARLMGSSKQA